MVDSFGTGVVSSSRGCGGGQGLCIEQLAELKQGGESDARLGCVAESAAGNRVEHPGGDGERRAVSKPDEVMASSQSPKAADDGDLLVV
jgi:hypothetical protein